MNFRLICSLSVIFFLTACSLSPNENNNQIIADGLSPKIIYQEAKNKEDSGTLEQAIDQYKIILEILQELEKINIYPRYVYRQDYYDYIFILTRNNSNKLKVPGISIKKEKTYLEIFHATENDRKEEGFRSYISDKIIHINSGQFWIHFKLSKSNFINKEFYKKNNKFTLEDLVILIKNLN